jgi:hypothetical protein
MSRDPLRLAHLERRVRWRNTICCALIVIAVDWRVGGYVASRIQMPQVTPTPLMFVMGAIVATGSVLQWRQHRLGG